MAGPEIKKLKEERHHWWPKVVSRHWADPNGRAHQIDNEGKEVTSKPANFGAIWNDNNIALARVPTVWDESFEKVFAKADNQFPNVIAWLRENSNAQGPTTGAWKDRIKPVVMADDMHAMLAECLASLIVRSPRFRNCVRSTTEYYRGRFGFTQPAEPALIGLGVRHCQEMFERALRRPGKFAIISAGSREFIFGDGFLSNFVSAAAAPVSPRCFVPITPEVAVFYTSPMQFRSDPKTHQVTLGPSEVAGCNNIVQIYAKRFIFYRSQRPELTDDFRRAQHLQLPYENHPSLTELSVAMGEIPLPGLGILDSWMAGNK
jgi:hypothetical protein